MSTQNLLLLRQRGIEKITVEEICTESMVSRRSFYRYFVDKFDLLAWTYNYDFCRMVEVRPDKTIWDYYPEILQYIYQDPQFFKKCLLLYRTELLPVFLF